MARWSKPTAKMWQGQYIVMLWAELRNRFFHRQQKSTLLRESNTRARHHNRRRSRCARSTMTREIHLVEAINCFSRAIVGSRFRLEAPLAGVRLGRRDLCHGRAGGHEGGAPRADRALADGQKVILAVDSGQRESTESWATVLRDLTARGLGTPKLTVADGHLGLWSALAQVWPESAEQRCWNHKLWNVLDPVPEKAQPEVKAHHRVRQPW
jgi:hypothetical protein